MEAGASRHSHPCPPYSACIAACASHALQYSRMPHAFYPGRKPGLGIP
ncbi:CRISPR-associated protein Cas5 [Ktedonobacter robiniae]